MTPMALPSVYPSTRRTGAHPAPLPRWRLLGAEVTTALIVTLGATAAETTRHADLGAVITTVTAGAVTRATPARPPITSW